MTYYEAITFIKTSRYIKADIKVNESVWKYWEAKEDEISDGELEGWDDEDDAEFACNLVNWYDCGKYIGIIKQDGAEESFDDMHIAPVVFEDEIAIILEKFTRVGSVIKFSSPYVDGRKEKTLKIVKNAGKYFEKDKYSVAVVYAIYDALENDYLVSFTTEPDNINDVDILDLLKQIEY